MKKIVFITVMTMTFVLGVSYAPGGGDVASAAEIKIGSVNIQSVLDKSTAVKRTLEEMKARTQKERDLLSTRQEEILALEKEVTQKGMMMLPDTLEAKEKKVRGLKRALKLYSEDITKELQDTQGKAMRNIYNDLSRITRQYGKDNGFSLIIDKGAKTSLTGPVVFYVDPALDITEEVIKLYNEEDKKNTGGK